MILLLGYKNDPANLAYQVLRKTDGPVLGVGREIFEDFQGTLEKHRTSAVISFIGKGLMTDCLSDTEGYKDMLDSNFVVQRKVVQQVLAWNPYTPILLANSIVSQYPYEGTPDYTASKCALDGWVKSLRAQKEVFISQLHFQGVRHIGIQPLVNCINAWTRYPSCNIDFIINR